MSGAHLFLCRLADRVSGFLQRVDSQLHRGGGDAGDPNLAHLLYLAFPDSALFFFPSFRKPLFDFKLLSTCTSDPFRTLTSCSFLPSPPSNPVHLPAPVLFTTITTTTTTTATLFFVQKYKSWIVCPAKK